MHAAMTQARPRQQPLEDGVSLSCEAAGASWGNLSGAERVLRVLEALAPEEVAPPLNFKKSCCSVL